jgi:hypothetical protein
MVDTPNLPDARQTGAADKASFPHPWSGGMKHPSPQEKYLRKNQQRILPRISLNGLADLIHGCNVAFEISFQR